MLYFFISILIIIYTYLTELIYSWYWPLFSLGYQQLLNLHGNFYSYIMIDSFLLFIIILTIQFVIFKFNIFTINYNIRIFLVIKCVFFWYILSLMITIFLSITWTYYSWDHILNNNYFTFTTIIFINNLFYICKVDYILLLYLILYIINSLPYSKWSLILLINVILILNIYNYEHLTYIIESQHSDYLYITFLFIIDYLIKIKLILIKNEFVFAMFLLFYITQTTYYYNYL